MLNILTSNKHVHVWHLYVYFTERSFPFEVRYQKSGHGQTYNQRIFFNSAPVHVIPVFLSLNPLNKQNAKQNAPRGLAQQDMKRTICRPVDMGDCESIRLKDKLNSF